MAAAAQSLNHLLALSIRENDSGGAAALRGRRNRGANADNDCYRQKPEKSPRHCSS
jgi:hypothetical protein